MIRSNAQCSLGVVHKGRPHEGGGGGSDRCGQMRTRGEGGQRQCGRPQNNSYLLIAVVVF